MFWEGQTAVLERVAAGHPLAEILHDIVALIEGQSEGMLCSILLLDADRAHVRAGAAAGLPSEYMALLDGLAIGPTAGSCGAAAYRAERVIVEDIATHPNWEGYKHLALPFGLRACWSTPILSIERDVLGTFAMYYRVPRGPTAAELGWVDAATHLAAIAIVSDHATKALRRDEARLRAIYDGVTDIVFYLAVEGEERYRFESVNRTFLAATGLREHDVVGRLVDEVIPAPSLVLVKAKYAEAMATGGPVAWDEVSRYPSGTKYGEVSVSPIHDAAGRCTHLLGTVHDVTERRAAEEDRRRLEEQLHQAQRLHALGTLAGGIAHDFNNILAAIHGNVELAGESLDAGHPAQEPLTDVKRAAQRASELVRQILTFGRKGEPRRELLDLRAIVEEALSLIRVTLPGATTVRRSFAEDVPRIRGDSTQVHQAVVNLVTNASHAIGESKGVIEVRLEREVVAPGERSDAPDAAAGVHARLTVRDDGGGMDPDTLRRVFEPFFTTKSVGKGTGLGLSVVHGVMKSHGGVVTVQSELGRGTTFELLFPATDDPEVEAQAANERPAGWRVLYVDDDEALVFLAKRAFSRLGHRIVAFSSSTEALEAFRASPADFDVVVTDMRMPYLDGAALIRELRRIRPDLRVVATTGFIRPEDRSEATELGVTDLFEKPQSLDDLAKLVEQRIH